MKRILYFIAGLFTLVGCQTESKIVSVEYPNIVIMSDLSSRLDNKKNKDFDEIHKIVEFFKNDCVQPGKKIGSKSSLSFASFGGKVENVIDLSQIKGISEKQQFVNSKGNYQGKGLDFELGAFESKVHSIYANTRNPGLDLISSLMEKVKSGSIGKRDTFVVNGVDTTYVNFTNHIYIFTDGYLEYNNENLNKQYYFGEKEIHKIRDYCIQNKTNITEALRKEPSLGLPAYPYSFNEDLELHVFETHERDKNDQLQTYKYATGLRDNEILEAVWNKWAKDSGFKSFEWKKY
ncbi:hypothetical protein K2F45_15755 [Sphingobacterium siyangense]|uniref:hypothetical protein n=1 Tax=Sphingobacterium siyangense TaxID=459529 RepID=UPI00200C3E0D|nr:hypothetical protein [Sphingobacterium siyangense]UQA73280.1 hypothetical protein K2F45_15755 [Sphingobacterium siyangense]